MKVQLTITTPIDNGPDFFYLKKDIAKMPKKRLLSQSKKNGNANATPVI